MDGFDDFYRAEYPRVLAACRALGAGAEPAGDATDEAFARAFERWPRVRQMASPGGWVQVVAINHLRRGGRRRTIEAVALRRRATAGHAPAPAPPDAELWGAVSRLPRRQQQCIVLRYVHDLAEGAIAETLGVTRGTVASTLDAARRSLRSRLGDRTLEDNEEACHG